MEHAVHFALILLFKGFFSLFKFIDFDVPLFEFNLHSDFIIGLESVDKHFDRQCLAIQRLFTQARTSRVIVI